MWLERKGQISYSAAEKGLEAIVNYRGSGGPQAGTGPDYVAYVFLFLGTIIICLLQQLTLSDQAQGTPQLPFDPADVV
jgi:hypothetical protein